MEHLTEAEDVKARRKESAIVWIVGSVLGVILILNVIENAHMLIHMIGIGVPAMVVIGGISYLLNRGE